VKINSNKLNELGNQFKTMRDYSVKDRDIAPLILDEVSGRYPIKVTVNEGIPNVVKKLSRPTTKYEELIKSVVKVLLKQ
jgi:hypothetical protein